MYQDPTNAVTAAASGFDDLFALTLFHIEDRFNLSSIGGHGTSLAAGLVLVKRPFYKADFSRQQRYDLGPLAKWLGLINVNY